MLPRKFFDKNGVIWCNHGRYVIYDMANLKINNFKGKNQQENLVVIFLSLIIIDEHVSKKINTFRIDKGGVGASPPEAE